MSHTESFDLENIKLFPYQNNKVNNTCLNNFLNVIQKLTFTYFTYPSNYYFKNLRAEVSSIIDGFAHYISFLIYSLKRANSTMLTIYTSLFKMTYSNFLKSIFGDVAQYPR